MGGENGGGGGVAGEQDMTVGSGRDVVPASDSNMDITSSAPSTVVSLPDLNDEGAQGTAASLSGILSNTDTGPTPPTS